MQKGFNFMIAIIKIIKRLKKEKIPFISVIKSDIYHIINLKIVGYQSISSQIRAKTGCPLKSFHSCSKLAKLSDTNYR